MKPKFQTFNKNSDILQSSVKMEEDQEHLELLKLLARYDLLLEQLQKSMREGFQNLGRANYHNKDTLRGRYGSDYWDEAYEGQLSVERGTDGRISFVKVKLDEDEKEEPIVDEKVDEKLHDEANLRKRNREAKEKKLKKLRHRDPLTMFGGPFSIPQSLRQCQMNFKGLFPLIEELINCKTAMTEVMTKLETSNN